MGLLVGLVFLRQKLLEILQEELLHLLVAHVEDVSHLLLDVHCQDLLLLHIGYRAINVFLHLRGKFSQDLPNVCWVVLFEDLGDVHQLVRHFHYLFVVVLFEGIQNGFVLKEQLLHHFTLFIVRNHFHEGFLGNSRVVEAGLLGNLLLGNLGVFGVVFCFVFQHLYFEREERSLLLGKHLLVLLELPHQDFL